MHSLLENYLTELSEQLSPLPVARRNDELREMRQHLLNAVIVSQETGLSEDEAARFAVDQFGVPQELGKNVVLVWRRGKQLDRRSFWGAFACVLTMMFVLSDIWQLCLNLTVSSGQVIPGHFPMWLQSVGLVCNYTPPLVGGAISGYLFPKRAIAGVFFASIVGCLWRVAEEYYYSIPAIQVAHHYMHIDHGWSMMIYLCMALFIVTNLLLTVLAAWSGRRWRVRQAQTSQG